MVPSRYGHQSRNLVFLFKNPALSALAQVLCFSFRLSVKKVAYCPLSDIHMELSFSFLSLNRSLDLSLFTVSWKLHGHPCDFEQEKEESSQTDD